MSIPGRSKQTYNNYSRHIAAIALHFNYFPTELDPEQVQDYLFMLQQRSKTPSEAYFKHTVYGLRSLELLETGKASSSSKRTRSKTPGRTDKDQTKKVSLLQDGQLDYDKNF